MKKLIFRVLTAILVLIIISLLYIFVITKPSNNRNWVEGMEKIAQLTISGDQLAINNIRDYRITDGKITSLNYLNRTFDVKKIEKVWFVFEPFTIKPFTNFNGVAHTYFVFDFKGEDPIAVSVEARREKAEKYDAFKGLFNQYELIYIWGTESDETIRRVVLEENPLYMYPLKISQTGAEKLFLQLAQTTGELETSPRFYKRSLKTSFES